MCLMRCMDDCGQPTSGCGQPTSVVWPFPLLWSLKCPTDIPTDRPSPRAFARGDLEDTGIGAQELQAEGLHQAPEVEGLNHPQGRRDDQLG